MIHPTALIDPRALLGQNVTVGPYTYIGAGVTLEDSVVVGEFCDIKSVDERGSSDLGRCGPVLGKATKIAARCSICGDVTIGTESLVGTGVTLRGPLAIGHRVRIFESSVLGNEGQFPGTPYRGGSIIIGDDCTIREFVVVNQPTLTMTTTVCEQTYLMSRCQIDHDCFVGANSKLASGVTLGGSVTIGKNSYLGMNVVTHQGLTLGECCMIGMNGVVMKNVPPFATLVDRKFSKINSKGVLKFGGTELSISAIEKYYSGSTGIETDIEGQRCLDIIGKFFADFGCSNLYQLRD